MKKKFVVKVVKAPPKKTVKRSLLAITKMRTGGVKPYERVVDKGILKVWLGTRWLDLGPRAEPNSFYKVIDG